MTFIDRLRDVFIVEGFPSTLHGRLSPTDVLYDNLFRSDVFFRGPVEPRFLNRWIVFSENLLLCHHTDKRLGCTTFHWKAGERPMLDEQPDFAWVHKGGGCPMISAHYGMKNQDEYDYHAQLHMLAVEGPFCLANHLAWNAFQLGENEVVTLALNYSRTMVCKVSLADFVGLQMWLQSWQVPPGRRAACTAINLAEAMEDPTTPVCEMLGWYHFADEITRGGVVRKTVYRFTDFRHARVHPALSSKKPPIGACPAVEEQVWLPVQAAVLSLSWDTLDTVVAFQDGDSLNYTRGNLSKVLGAKTGNDRLRHNRRGPHHQVYVLSTADSKRYKEVRYDVCRPWAGHIALMKAVRSMRKPPASLVVYGFTPEEESLMNDARGRVQHEAVDFMEENSL